MVFRRHTYRGCTHFITIINVYGLKKTALLEYMLFFPKYLLKIKLICLIHLRITNCLGNRTIERHTRRDCILRLPIKSTSCYILLEDHLFVLVLFILYHSLRNTWNHVTQFNLDRCMKKKKHSYHWAGMVNGQVSFTIRAANNRIMNVNWGDDLLIHSLAFPIRFEWNWLSVNNK